MVLKMFAVYDAKAEAFLNPFFMPATGMAVRAFTDLVQDKRTNVGMHPDDYKLVYIADFDDHTAEVVPAGNVSLGFGSDFVVKSDVVPLKGVA